MTPFLRQLTTNNRKSSSKKERGFTLTEVLVSGGMFSMVMAGMKHPRDEIDPYSAAGIDKALEMELSRPQNAAGVQMVQPPSNPEQPDVYV